MNNENEFPKWPLALLTLIGCLGIASFAVWAWIEFWFRVAEALG